MHRRGVALHPLTALAVAAWGPLAAWAGDPLPPLAFGAALASVSGRARQLAGLYAWLAASMFLVGWLAVGPEASAEATLRALAAAVPASAAAALVPPQWAAYAGYRARLPPTAAYSLAIALRLADYYRSSLWEVMDALRGRGVRGRLALALKAPIPLVVHVFQSTSALAEALQARGPRRGKTWAERPKPGPLDAVALLALGAWCYRLLRQLNPDFPPIV